MPDIHKFIFRLRYREKRRWIGAAVAVTALISVTVLIMLTTLVFVCLKSTPADKKLTAGEEVVDRSIWQQIIDYCLPTSNNYDTYDEEIKPQSLLSSIMKFMFNVDFRDLHTVVMYQLHASHIKASKTGFKIVDGEIVYDNYQNLPEAIRFEIGQIEDNWQSDKGNTKKKPVVYIYHTHTHEAYDPTGMPYKEIEAWRTDNNLYNVVGVGEALTRYLTNLGVEVIHDKSDYEGTAYSKAYASSLKGLKAIKAERDDIDLYIDLHRNAYNENGEVSRALELADGSTVARMMCVIGTGEGMEEKPNWKENYKLALRITNQVNSLQKDICYPVAVWDGRYNQHISTNAVLIEVGHNLNTFNEAEGTMKFLAQAIADILIDNQ